MFIQAVHYTCTTKLHHTLWNALCKLQQCNQNVTTSCHTVHKLTLCTGIKLNQWQIVPRFWCESKWNGQKNVLCDELFVLLRQKVLLGGKYMQSEHKSTIVSQNARNYSAPQPQRHKSWATQMCEHQTYCYCEAKRHLAKRYEDGGCKQH